MRISNQVQALDVYRRNSIGYGRTSGKTGGLASTSHVGGNPYDAKGLVISGRMRTQNGGLSETSRSVQERISRVQVAEARLQKADGVLSRMHDLAVAAANGGTSDADRIVLDYDFTQYRFELSKLGKISFHGFNPEPSGGPGATGAASSIEGYLAEAAARATNVETLGNIRNVDSARGAMAAIGEAKAGISSAQADLGDIKASLIDGLRSARNSAGKQQGAESRIRDAGAARDMVDQIRGGLLSKPAESTTAQANARPQGITTLLA